jgi:hypothetical protein
MSQEKPCVTCKFHIHLTDRTHLQHCTKFKDHAGEPKPCMVARPFDCDGKGWEAVSSVPD